MAGTKLGSILLLCALVVLASLSPADSQPRTKGCLKAGCPPKTSKICGLYTSCKTFSLKEKNITTCDSCAPFDLKKVPTSTCNYTVGRCLPNVDAGKACTAKQLNQPCNKKNPSFICSKVNQAVVTAKNPQAYKCCRPTCPPGMCGTPGLTFKNQCNQTLSCDAKCAPKAAKGVSISYR